MHKEAIPHTIISFSYDATCFVEFALVKIVELIAMRLHDGIELWLDGIEQRLTDNDGFSLQYF